MHTLILVNEIRVLLGIEEAFFPWPVYEHERITKGDQIYLDRQSRTRVDLDDYIRDQFSDQGERDDHYARIVAALPAPRMKHDSTITQNIAQFCAKETKEWMERHKLSITESQTEYYNRTLEMLTIKMRAIHKLDVGFCAYYADKYCQQHITNITGE